MIFIRLRAPGTWGLRRKRGHETFNGDQALSEGLVLHRFSGFLSCRLHLLLALQVQLAGLAGGNSSGGQLTMQNLAIWQDSLTAVYLSGSLKPHLCAPVGVAIRVMRSAA